MDPIYVIFTTYLRQEIALRTVRAFCEHVCYREGEIYWMVCDDGSPRGYLDPILEVLGPKVIGVINGERRGVGWMMNKAIRTLGEAHKAQLFFFLEDDWEIRTPLDMSIYAQLLLRHTDLGMVRFGYIFPNLLGTIISREGRLWWKLEHNGETYRFVGHPSLRHYRFHEKYGLYAEGLPPGETELSMCARVNALPQGPAILLPIPESVQWGYFHHIGAESLADIHPGR